MKARKAIEYWMFTEAWLLLALSRFLILFRPFRSLTPILGKTVTRDQAELAAANPTTELDLLLLVQLSIRRAGARSPWRTMCFENALTAKIMLRSRKKQSVVFFGITTENIQKEPNMKAHAWLICSGFTVTGGKNNSRFTIVGTFL